MAHGSLWSTTPKNRVIHYVKDERFLPTNTRPLKVPALCVLFTDVRVSIWSLSGLPGHVVQRENMV